jgi:hypothetical protein
VESAGIGLIASLVKADPNVSHAITYGEKEGLIVALVAFILAIVAAGIVISAIPDSITDIQPGQAVMDRRVYFVARSFGFMYVYVELLFGLFLVGLIALATSVIHIMLRS